MAAHSDAPPDAPPLVSILTPSYNYARFLPDALRSVTRQTTARGVEHVVVDDGSTDGSAALLEAWPEPLVFRAKENEGLTATLNTALQLARGEWIGWLNADDFYLPGALAEVERVAREDSDVIHGDTILVEADGRIRRHMPQHPMHRRTLVRNGPFMHPPSVFMRRSILPETPWDPGLRQYPDWDLWLRLANLGARFRYVPRPFSAFRWHEAQLSRNQTPLDRHEHETMARRYGVPLGERSSRTARVAGKVEHGLMKLRHGAYVRQFRVMREFRGVDIRWFESDDALRRVEHLLERVNGRPSGA